MTRARRNICLLAAVAALSTTSLLPSGAVAAASTRNSGLTAGPQTTVQVVATGLNVPRGLVYDRANDRLLIAEAGVASGNTSPCTTTPAGGTVCYGATGSVYAFSLNPNGPDGNIITGLPSFSDSAQNFVQGLEGLSLYQGQLTGVFSLSGTVATRTGLGPGAADLGQAVVFGPCGQVTPVADVAAFEAQLYGSQAQSDPWGVATGPFGTLIANADGTPAPGSDYGGNDVLQLQNGQLTQLVAFPQRTFDGNVMDSAPTTVVQGPDSAFYVGELTSYPYYAGAADVWRVVPGQAPTVFASGFSKIIDIAFDPQGQLLVLDNGGRNSPAELIEVNRDGSQTVLVSGLNAPCGIAVVNANTYYITNDGGGVGGDGELLKVTLNGG